MPVSWDEIQNSVQFYAAITAVPLNVLLIYLIIKYSSSEIGAYKYLMIYISVFELIYAIIDVIVSPFAHAYGSTFLVIVNLKKTSIPRWVHRILLSAYCGFYGCSMAIFGIHFVYRYLVAKGSDLLKTFQSKKIIGWLLIPAIFGLIWSCLTYWPCAKRESTDIYVKDNLYEKFNLSIDDVEYIAPYFYELDKNGNLEIYWPSFVGIGVNSVIINVSIATIIYFGKKCYTILNSLVPHTSKSEKNRRLQKQLYFALVTQTLIPIVLMHIPVSTLYFSAFFCIDLGSISGIAPLAIALYPTLDPLPTMFIIGHYRTVVFNWILWLPRKFGICSKNSVNPEIDETTVQDGPDAVTQSNAIIQESQV